MNRSFFFKQFVLAVSLTLYITSVGCDSSAPDKPITEPIEDPVEVEASPVHVMMHQRVGNISAWQASLDQAVAENQGITFLRGYRSAIDSTDQYALLEADNQQTAEEFNAGLVTFLKEEEGPLFTYLNAKEELQLENGTGTYFLHIRHPVTDFEQWYSTFKKYNNYKEADSIYTLGVFTEPGNEIVNVLVRAEQLIKVSEYGRFLRQNQIMERAGVTANPETVILLDRKVVY